MNGSQFLKLKTFLHLGFASSRSRSSPRCRKQATKERAMLPRRGGFQGPLSGVRPTALLDRMNLLWKRPGGHEVDVSGEGRRSRNVPMSLSLMSAKRDPQRT